MGAQLVGAHQVMERLIKGLHSIKVPSLLDHSRELVGSSWICNQLANQLGVDEDLTCWESRTFLCPDQTLERSRDS